MSPMDHNNPSNAREPVDRDLLISRVVDDAASAGDWEQLRALADYDPSVWRELFEAQHAQAELAEAVQQAIAIADGIDAPVDQLLGGGFRFRIRQVSTWAGWAAAASVAIFFMAPNLTGPATPAGATGGSLAGNAPAPDTASSEGGALLAGALTERDAGDRESSGFVPYIPRGLATRDPVISDTPQYDRSFASQPYRVVSDLSGVQTPQSQQLAEMPDRVLLEVRPLPNGQLELIYVRRLIEKAVVNEDDLYQVKPDDAGIDRTVPYRTRRPSSGPI